MQVKHGFIKHQFLIKEIQEFLGPSARFMYAGSSAWYAAGVHLGQTVVFSTLWIYNNVFEGTKMFGKCKVRFFNTEFPDIVTKEFWCIDAFNNCASMDVSDSTMIRYLIRLIKKDKFQLKELLNTCNQYGNVKTKGIFESEIVPYLVHE
jgi:hypothetical protein